jgi:F-type H+-transporting ATPase subunit epsilon
MLQLELVSPERLLVSEKVDEIQLPGLDGYLGILPGHAALMSALKPGVLRYRIGSGEKVVAVYGGFVEVRDDRVRVLADAAQPKEEINIEQAREELRKVNPDSMEEMARAQAKLDAAL